VVLYKHGRMLLVVSWAFRNTAKIGNLFSLRFLLGS
jgi:hypothetical protein